LAKLNHAQGAGPVPNPVLAEAEQKILKIKEMGADPAMLQQAEAELAAAPQQEISSVPVDEDPRVEDHETEAMACWPVSKFLRKGAKPRKRTSTLQRCAVAFPCAS